MPNRKSTFLIPFILGCLIVLGAVLLQTTQAKAQCGSQASSCKNCHETQAQMAVNNDGKGWHTGHAFGDFCYACHGGNNQSMDKDQAHAGMVPPMSDIKTACQGCHPNDLNERSQVYASALGIDLQQAGPAGQAAPAATAAPTTESAGASATEAPAAGSITSGGAPASPSGGEVVDYSQRNDETAGGKTPVNWGNVILVILIVLTAAGGGTFVYFNERKLRGLSVKTVVKPSRAAALPTVEGYAPEVVALLPQLACLDPLGLNALKRLLRNPEQASEMLHALAQLDPDLVRRIRALDREARELLLAMAGD